ncbi:MAG: DUF4292 domain-containing protein [candidate division Zixibacteria bacterium]|nr:DUF4292 domain-containing protein [candidate division Zixibacteria bacterium]
MHRLLEYLHISLPALHYRATVLDTTLKVVFLILFSLLIMLACGPKPEIQLPRERLNPDVIADNLATQERFIKSAASSMRINLYAPDKGKQSFTATLYNDEEKYFFQLEATLGKDVAKILVDNDKTTGYLSMEKSFYSGNSDNPIPEWGLSIKEILKLIVGKFGIYKKKIRYVGMVEGFYFYEQENNEFKRKITVRPETGNITGIRYQLNDENLNMTTIDIRYADFSQYEDFYRPGRISIIMRESGVNLDIEIKSERLNQDLPSDLFKLKIPENAKEVEESWFWDSY